MSLIMKELECQNISSIDLSITYKPNDKDW